MSTPNKDAERSHLLHFLRARQSAIGEPLAYVRDSESPDFICRKPDGSEIGIEHTRVAYSSKLINSMTDDEWNEAIDDWEVFWSAYNAFMKKESLRQKPHWKIPNATILVLDFVHGIALQNWKDDEDLSDDFADSGFVEVWLTDHSTIETHGTVTAIGLYPKSIWGVRGQGHLGAPPYK